MALITSLPNDTTRVNTLNALLQDLRNKGEYTEALPYAAEAEKLSRELHFDKGLAAALHALGTIYSYQGEYPKALEQYNASLKIKERTGDKKGKAFSLNGIGEVYRKQGDYPKALRYYLETQSIVEDLKDKKSMATCYNNIGLIHSYQGDYTKTIHFYTRSLRLREELGDTFNIAGSLNNIGLIYHNIAEYDKAMEYHQKALTLRKIIHDERGIANSLNNIGNVNSELGDHKEALKNYFEALAIYNSKSDKRGCALAYNNIGTAYYRMGAYTEALANCSKSLEIARSINSLDDLRMANISLSQVCEKMGKHSEALAYYKQYIQARDSLVNQERTKDLVQRSMQYEFDRKEATTRAEQEKKDLIAGQESQRQKIIRNSLLAGISFVILLGALLLNGYRQKQKANKLLEERNTVIEKQNQVVEAKNKDITDSINYAKRIQDALLPKKELVTDLFPESFLYFRPRDIVSGDFYWMSDRDGKKLIAAADCTGHGVPGAFMSMIGNAFLNEVVNDRGITRPHEVLDQLRHMVIRSLRQADEESRNRDGMDIALLCYDDRTGIAEFSGANNPLWMFRKESKELVELSPNKRPIGYFKGEGLPFDGHTQQLKKGDTLYLFTDGFADQFGGPRGKKFMYKQLKQLLGGIQDKTMKEQEALLDNAFTQWKGDQEQVDDVLVIGIRI